MNDSPIRKIEEDQQVTFPCWLFDSQGYKDVVGPRWVHWNEAIWELDPPKAVSLLGNGFTHWHPDQHESPTVTPAIHVLSQQLREEKSEVDAVINATRGERGVYDELDRMTALARKLESERDAWKRSDNRHCQTLHEIGDILSGRKNCGYIASDVVVLAKRAIAQQP